MDKVKLKTVLITVFKYMCPFLLDLLLYLLTVYLDDLVINFEEFNFWFHKHMGILAFLVMPSYLIIRGVIARLITGKVWLPNIIYCVLYYLVSVIPLIRGFDPDLFIVFLLSIILYAIFFAISIFGSYITDVFIKSSYK